MCQPPDGDTAVHFPLSFLTHHLRMNDLGLFQEFQRHVIKLLSCDCENFVANLDTNGRGALAEGCFELLFEPLVCLNLVNQLIHRRLGAVLG